MSGIIIKLIVSFNKWFVLSKFYNSYFNIRQSSSYRYASTLLFNSKFLTFQLEKLVIPVDFNYFVRDRCKVNHFTDGELGIALCVNYDEQYVIFNIIQNLVL